MKRLVKHGGWVLLLILAGIGQWRLHLDVDILNLLPPDQPTVQGLKLHQRHFANARELIISLRGSDAEQLRQVADALAQRLRRESNLVANVTWQPPWMEHPEQLAEMVACLWLNQPPEQFRALTNRLRDDQLAGVAAEAIQVLSTSLSPMDIARRAVDPYDLLNLPALSKISGLSMDEGEQMFASAGGTFRVLFVEGRPDLSDYRVCARWLNAVQAIIDDFRAHQPQPAEWVLRLTGGPVFVTEFATRMQHDLAGSVTGAAVVIALLFWLVHRRWVPLFWLLALLALILVTTLALGGLVLGTISVVSMGFAAVLLGLAVDYAAVHYQEALAHPRLSVPEIRRAIAPSVLWAAITTISAFLVLNLGGLPGLAQLGTLVGIGVGLAALVMMAFYLPPLFPERRQSAAAVVRPAWWSYLLPSRAPLRPVTAPAQPPSSRSALWVTGMLVGVAVLGLCYQRPTLDKTGDALRPERGEAETALEEVTTQMGIARDALWMVVPGSSEAQVLARLTQAESLLIRATSNHVVRQFNLPLALWPRPELQARNRAAAARLGRKGPQLRAAAVQAGFDAKALFLTDALVRTWARAGNSRGVVWPTNDVSQWLLKRFVARAPHQWLVLGLVYPATNAVKRAALPELSAQLFDHHILLAGWELLGKATLKRVEQRQWVVLTPMVLLVLVSLGLAFGRWTEVLLGLAVLFLSGLCLLAIMAWAGWSWNLLNLMALPLMLGTGVDYGIFMQMAMRRNAGNLALVRRSTGRAVLLCGSTAIAGFGALSWSGYPGMASLGKVCAVGIGANMLIAIFLLPGWWLWFNARANPARRNGASASAPLPASPSFYRAGLWRLGLATVRLLPAWAVQSFCVVLAEWHCRWRRKRREVVVQNLLPACAGDRRAAEQTTRRLYRNFGVKLADLWRIESGVPVRDWVTHPDELEIVQTAWARGRGLLFLTLHLGNWEHGGLLLAKLGIPLTVLTLAEPDERLTQLRIASRARWGIKTLIVGQDSFALVKVIERLQAGAAMAISIDRPLAQSDGHVQLFGRPFKASLAAAELARASGCALVGVTIVRQRAGYAVKILPEFTYDRPALGSREARRELTQKIMRAFEPEIRNHLDQWYQFVPIWPKDESCRATER